MWQLTVQAISEAMIFFRFKAPKNWVNIEQRVVGWDFWLPWLSLALGILIGHFWH